MGEKEYESKEPSRPLVAGESPPAVANRLRLLLRDAKNQTRDKRTAWNANSNAAFLIQLSLGLGATIVVGVAASGVLERIGFALAASATAATAVEAWFAWRARAVAADRALARWHAAEDQLEMYVAVTKKRELSLERLQEIDAERVETWSEYSQSWLAARGKN